MLVHLLFHLSIRTRPLFDVCTTSVNARESDPREIDLDTYWFAYLGKVVIKACPSHCSHIGYSLAKNSPDDIRIMRNLFDHRQWAIMHSLVDLQHPGFTSEPE